MGQRDARARPLVRRAAEVVVTPSLEARVSELHAVVARASPGVGVADDLCTACVDLLGVDGAAVSLIHDGASRGTFGASSAGSRRLDELQFTFGEGPCLDAVASRTVVLAPDLESPEEQRWPALVGALLEEGIRGVFALPIMITSECVGALDLFRDGPGQLDDDQLALALVTAELAAAPLLDLMTSEVVRDYETGSGGGQEHLIEMDRVEVYQATGMLISQLGVGATEAMLRLRAHAIATGQTATQVAWAIIERTLVLDGDVPGGGSGDQ